MVKPIPNYTCVLSELTIYNAGFKTLSNFARTRGPLEEYFGLSNFHTPSPRNLDGSRISKLTLGFGNYVNIDPDFWEVWERSV